MKRIPDELAFQQQQKREGTVKAVRKAIDDICVEGGVLTVGLIMKHSGLSRSVFSKPHVKEILREHGVGAAKKIPLLNKTDDLKAEKLRNESRSKDDTIKQLRHELEAKNLECELLRGKLHVLMQNCRIKGIDIDIQNL